MHEHPHIHFQVPLAENLYTWARLDRAESKYEVDLVGKIVSGYLSATQLRALVILLENSQTPVPHECFDRNHAQTMADLRDLFAQTVADGNKGLLHMLKTGCMTSWISGPKGNHMISVPAYQGCNGKRIDRLFRSHGAGLLRNHNTSVKDDSETPSSTTQRSSLEPTKRIPCVAPQKLPPVVVNFAAERAFFNGDGIRQILRPKEKPKEPEWQPTVDDLSGDTVAVALLSALLAEYHLRSQALPPDAAAKIMESHPDSSIFFVGSSYANPFLCGIEEREAADSHYGARFDCKALISGRGLRVTFESESSSAAWLERHHMDRSRDIAVIRRWRTKGGADAMMAAGMTAQGTLGAVRFLCEDRYIDRLFKHLLPDPFDQNTDDVEFLQFDAVLGVPLKKGMVDSDEEICILEGTPHISGNLKAYDASAI